MLKSLVKDKFDFLTFVFILSLIFVGGFHEEVSCLISVILSVGILIFGIKNKEFSVKINPLSVAVGVLVLFYGLSCFWAVDRGMALFGIIKYFPVLLFVFCYFQNEKPKDTIMEILPYFVGILAVLTAVLMQIPAFKDYFSVAGRFSGSFQYPNTFALLLLISELIILSKDKIKSFDFVLVAVLLLAVFYTGSRTVFVLTVISNIAMIFTFKNKKVKWIFFGLVTLCVVFVLLYSLIFGSDILNRFLRISLKESTFVGRLLYFKDALPVIAKHPFGLGFNGYYYTQQTFETGMYIQRHIHNDFLQIMLDVGWIPFVFVIFAIIKQLFSKDMSVQRKIIIITFVLHSCFDFNLQFVSMCFLLFVLLDTKGGKKYTLKHYGTVAVLSCVVTLINLYFGTAVLCFRFKAYETADKLYPFYTDNSIEMLKNAETAEEMDSIADKILNQNSYVSLAYSAKSRVAYSKGDIKSLITYKHKVFETSPYNYEDCEEYCYMLINNIALYTRDGDLYSAEYCKSELVDTADRVNSLGESLSYFGKMIVDQPKTDLPEDISDYVKNIKAETK